ncbi:MAG: hypothetical protein WBC30_11970, partial [Candidatus Sulfotelmatobacter sp.]
MTKRSLAHPRRRTTWRAAVIALFVLSLIPPPISQAQAAPAISVDVSNEVSNGVSNYVRSEMQRQHIPGVA